MQKKHLFTAILTGCLITCCLSNNMIYASAAATVETSEGTSASVPETPGDKTNNDPAPDTALSQTTILNSPVSTEEICTSLTGSEKEVIVTKETVVTIEGFSDKDKLFFMEKELSNQSSLPLEDSSFHLITSIRKEKKEEAFIYYIDSIPLYSVHYMVDTDKAHPISTTYYKSGAEVSFPAPTMLPDVQSTFKGWQDKDGNMIQTLKIEKDTYLTASFQSEGHLESIETPTINAFPHGTPLEEILRSLPAHSTLNLDNKETASAPITWNISSDFSYNPALNDAQSFTVSGVIELPDSIKNSKQIDLNVSLDIKVYANTITTHHLTYDLNGADGVTPDGGNYSYGEKVSLPTDSSFSKPHHIFKGWSENKDGSSTYVNQYRMPASDMTLYAVFEELPQYTVTFASKDTDLLLPAAIKSYHDEQVILPFELPQKNQDVILSGWSIHEDADSPNYTSHGENSLYLDDDITLYAVTEERKEVRVTYDLNGGKGTLPVDSNVYAGGEEVPLIYPTDLQMEHHTFLGWSLTDYSWSADFPIGTSSFTMPNEDVTLYAVWAEDTTYHISYSANGGKNSPVDSTSYYKGATAQVIFTNLPEWENHTFLGWSPTPDAETPMFKQGGKETFTIQSDIVLYAVWLEKKYATLNYHPNGGTGGPKDDTHYYEGDRVTLDFEHIPTNYGHDFLGWDDKPDAVTPKYTKNGTNYIEILTDSEVSVRTIYAIWGSEKKKQVRYHTGNDGEGTAPVDRNTYYAGDEVNLNFEYKTNDRTLTFLGWSHNANTDIPDYTPDGNSTLIIENESVDLYPVFSSNTHMDASLNLSYSLGNGTLSAKAEFGKKEPESITYTWYRDGAIFRDGDANLKPTEPGTYKCSIKDASGKYTNAITSNSITLYQVSSKENMIDLDNDAGLYRQGDTVTATYRESESTIFSKWEIYGIHLKEDKLKQNPLVFPMPTKDLTLSASSKRSYTISISGGTASTYRACEGETVSVKASRVENMEFSKWISSGIYLNDVTAEETSFVMPSSNVSLRASFRDKEVTPVEETKRANDDGDILSYYVIDSGGSAVSMSHAEQGHLCEAVFKLAAGGYNIYPNYYNLFYGNSIPPVYKSKNPVTIQMDIPEHLQETNRAFRMVCVSQFGIPYVLEDKDADPNTITFTTDHFYAFALLYKDIETMEDDSSPIEEETPSVESPIQDASFSQTIGYSGSSIKDASLTQTGFSLYTPVTRSYVDKSNIQNVVQNPDALVL